MCSKYLNGLPSKKRRSPPLAQGCMRLDVSEEPACNCLMIGGGGYSVITFCFGVSLIIETRDSVGAPWTTFFCDSAFAGDGDAALVMGDIMGD